MNITEIKGGVTAAKGFEAAAAAAAIKYQGRTDMALVYSEKPCHAAGTFTTNLVKAAPVKWDQKIVKESPYAQAVIVNSGIANACTGEEGMGYCRRDRRGSSQGSGRSGKCRSGGVHRRHWHAASHGSPEKGHQPFKGSQGQHPGARNRSLQGDYDHRYGQ